MAYHSIPVYTCDRCKHREEIRSGHDEYKWGKLTYMQVNGSLNLVSVSGTWPSAPAAAKDLCFNCLNELDKWYWQRKV